MKGENESQKMTEKAKYEGVLCLLKGEKARKSTKRRAQGDRLFMLKQAADMACEAIVELMADDKQFCRHAYQDKATGEMMEATLSMRNVKQMRETIQAIRDLADAIRSLYGLLSPDEEREMEMQLKKLQLEEKKLTSGAEDGKGETGVVILPLPEEKADG